MIDLISKKTAAMLALPAMALATPVAALDLPAPQAAHHPAVTAAAPQGDVVAQHNRGRHRGHARDQRYTNYNRYDRQAYGQNYYGEPVYQNTRVWQGDDGRYYCRRSNGTTGLLIGGAAGALLGREVARDRTLGAILGGAGGALLGRSVDRGQSRCR